LAVSARVGEGCVKTRQPTRAEFATGLVKDLATFTGSLSIRRRP